MPLTYLHRAFVVVIAALPWYGVRGASSQIAEAGLPAQVRITQYRTWTRVNSRPIIFHAANAVQCAVFPQQQPSPHRDKYITVYVNEVGKSAMLTQNKPVFPDESVIVKEKKASPDAPPELLTVMIKRPKGYNPPSGDWEYAVLDGKAAQVQAQGRLAKCQSCHQTQKRLDYTFRDAYYTYHSRRPSK